MRRACGSKGSGCGGAVDVLVEASGFGAGVGTNGSCCGVDGATLENIGTIVVFVCGLAGIDAGYGVAIVGPGSVREAAEGGDPEIVAVEGHGASVELFVVGVAGEVGDAGRSGPGVA